MNDIHYIKCVIVGDGGVGKTCLCHVYQGNGMEYLPIDPRIPSMYTIFEGHTINLQLFDTAGKEDYDRFRPFSYPQTVSC